MKIPLTEDQRQHIFDFLDSEIDTTLAEQIKYNICNVECSGKDFTAFKDFIKALIKDNRKIIKFMRICKLFSWIATTQEYSYWYDIYIKVNLCKNGIPEEYRKKSEVISRTIQL